MRIALLSNKKTRPTAYNLLEAGGVDELVVSSRRESLEQLTSDLVVRWGSTKRLRQSIPEINSAEAIALSADKEAALKVMRDGEVPTPELTQDFPCIGRSSHHTRGNGFWICMSRLQMIEAARAGATHFLEIYPKTKEYRVHVAFGMVLFVQEKIGDSISNLIWNKKTGFSFQVIPQSEWRKEIIEPAIKAVELLGLDFGAVDVMSDPTKPLFGFLFNNRPLKPVVVCEVNTAPALEGYSLEKYTSLFSDISEFGEKPTWLNLEKKYAQSYRYKDYKLERGEA